MRNGRHFPERITRHSYWLAVVLPLLMPLAWLLRDVPGMAAWFTWSPLLVLYALIPLLDLVIGRDLANPQADRGSFYPDTLIPVLAGVCFLGVLAWSLSVSSQVLSEHGALALLGWVLSLGDIGGAIGINVAHELIHRSSRPLRMLGGLMLASVWYPGFKLEHTRWHHVHVSTPGDPSSAPVGSTVYGRVPRAVWLNSLKAFELGAEAARARGRALAWLLNEVTGWYAVSALLTLTVGMLWGWLPALVLFAQGLVAALLLEIINYVEHYGLERERRPDGRYVPPNVTHSWDCDYWLSNAMLIQLPRHADHHTHPRREFSILQKNPSSPLLPLGYPLLVLIAMVPPLWRRVVHPHLPPRIEADSPSGG